MGSASLRDEARGDHRGEHESHQQGLMLSSAREGRNPGGCLLLEKRE